VAEQKEQFSATMVAVLGTLVAFGPMSIDMYLPSLPAIGAALGASTAGVQLTLSAFFVGFCLGQLLYGPLSDRLGRRPMLLGGITLYIATSALCASSESIEYFIAFRFLHALGGGAGTVVARAAVRDRLDTEGASRVLSFMMLIAGVAPLAAPVAGGYVLDWWGWRAIFWVLTGFGVVCWLLVALALPETNPRERRPQGHVRRAFSGYLAVLRSRTAVATLLCGGFGFAGLFAYISGTPFIYIELFKVSPQTYGYLFGLNVVGAAAGSLINARLVQRVGAANMLTVGTVIIAGAGVVLLVAAALQIGGLVGLVVPLFFFVGTLNLIAANAISIASAGFPLNAGATAALFGACQFGLGAVAGTIVGQLHDDTPIPMAATIAACGLAALALNLYLRRS